MLLIQPILILLLSLLSLSILYLAFLAIIYFFYKPLDTYSIFSPKMKFVILVPAHNEALGISETLDSLKEIDYPSDLYDIIVILDNCTDNTLESVKKVKIKYMKRHDPTRKGKGYALEYAISRLIKEDYDAFVIVDADSLISKNFLRSMNNRLLSGQKVIQAYDGLSNPDASALTYLFFIGNVIENKLFYEAKSRLDLSANLRGNGMCFSRDILIQYPWNTHSIVEDTEYGLKLIRLGIKIYFASEAAVFAKQPVTLRQAHTQRVRWASGNFKISKSYILKLILASVFKRNIRLFDTALSLFLLSKPFLLLLSFLLIGGAFFIFSINSEMGRIYLGWSFFLLSVQVIYLTTGILMERLYLKRIRYILFSPFLIIWFFFITIFGFFGYQSNLWQRTKRIG